ncbi:MAG: hypothetical protein HZC29_05825, partial [Thaumarchaeota archaeon]|nr:hypothetical protein [Nitrososphaerota archaeon]
QKNSLVFVGSPGKAKNAPSLLEIAKKMKNKNQDKLLLCVIFSESIDANNKKPLAVNQISDLTIVVNNSKTDSQDIMSKRSDVSIRFLEINGTLLMQSEIPWSHAYAVSVNRNNTNPHIDLEPIV